ncbi:Protein of unknown function (DUF2975) [Lutibacter sp. Hel_I_33_5]|uniref:DUF2975 domain-containing protein n=1 Tax=Lutibacter sp. Hel_I_33_5 TaxID=1566289 RepID=UPI0011A167ED|nr:DUF2975 domain-containing protein [Lutibacter sp. Hel_I_33_5]TVZ56545.1 Protein of unknown function (DUF2975) [Lutibacter sp. Hel_I_33_5]
MKTINTLGFLINLLFYTLVIFALIIVFLIFGLMFFESYLPYNLRQFKQVFNLMNDWRFFIIPITTLINFFVFIYAILLLKKCIIPFKNNLFFSESVIKNLKVVGYLFFFIGIITILIKFLNVLAMYESIQNAIAISYLSSIDIGMTFLIIIGLFFLIFSKSFENAKILQKENELTI